MKVICAPDKFKGSLTAVEAAAAMQRGILRARPDAVVDLCPIADGGEGFLDTLHAAQGGTIHLLAVSGPRHQPVQARWLSLSSADGPATTAAIEMAQASGLQLVEPGRRDPTRSTTYGTGQLIRAAIAAGHRQLLVGIGGSATNDGGIGMAAALGVRFFDDQGDELLIQPAREIDLPTFLRRVHRIDVTAARQTLKEVNIIAACDVDNPLTGPRGASAIYGPQKGSTPQQVVQLDEALSHLARRASIELGVDHSVTPGSGAAGGLGFGLLAFAGAALRPGIDLVLDAVRFDSRLTDCDLCLTGEGRLDEQSLAGKACIGVAQAAGRRGVPAVAVVGSAAVSPKQAQQAGLTSYHVISEGRTLEESLRDAAWLIESTTASIIQSWT